MQCPSENKFFQKIFEKAWDEKARDEKNPTFAKDM